jgi:hypothetical protein
MHRRNAKRFGGNLRRRRTRRARKRVRARSHRRSRRPCHCGSRGARALPTAGSSVGRYHPSEASIAKQCLLEVCVPPPAAEPDTEATASVNCSLFTVLCFCALTVAIPTARTSTTCCRRGCDRNRRAKCATSRRCAATSHASVVPAAPASRTFVSKSSVTILYHNHVQSTTEQPPPPRNDLREI